MVGQAAFAPSQVAARVSVPLLQLAARHWVVESNAFAGQFIDEPLQVSAGSHTPALGRQVTLPAGTAVQVPWEPATLHARQSFGFESPQSALQQKPSSH